jgi:HK97 family phage prohead protease/HK97 family phage major capsid protein
MEQKKDREDGLNGKRRYISGYATVFNELSVDLGGFREIILPESADRQMINESDILMPVNHNRDIGLLSRSKFGTGSLRVEVDEKGVFFVFEVPNTQPGNDMYELINRGDITQTSFSFTVPEGGDEIIEESTGIVRQVKKRELEKLIDGIEGEEISEEDQAKIDALEEEIAALEEELEAVAAPEPNGERNIKVVGGGRDVEKRFSLLRAVRNAVEKRAHDPITQAIIDAGRNELLRARIISASDIVLPESRDAVQATIAGKGLEAIATEKLDLIGPLYQELSLNKVGATFLTGLVSDVSIPVHSGTTTGWAGEIAPAADGAGTKLKPRRLTAVVNISTQFLMQESVSADALLRSDILEAIRQKLEQTLLGAEPATNVKPAGLFYVDPSLEKLIVTNYRELLDVEIELLNRNATAKYYLTSPAAYANLRQIAKPEAAVTDSNRNLTVGASIVDRN